MDKKKLRGLAVPEVSLEDIERAATIQVPEGICERGIRYLVRCSVNDGILMLSLLDVKKIQKEEDECLAFQVFCDRKEESYVNRDWGGGKPKWTGARLENKFFKSSLMFTEYAEQKLAAGYFEEENAGSVFDALSSFEKTIGEAVRWTKVKKKADEVDEAMKKVGAVDPGLREWVSDGYLKPKLFYDVCKDGAGKPTGECTVKCTYCGGEGTVQKAKAISHRNVTECPFCGMKAEVLCRNRIPSGWTYKYAKIAMLQKVSETEYLWRYFSTAEHIDVEKMTRKVDDLFEVGRDFVQIKDPEKGEVEYERYEYFDANGRLRWWKAWDNGTRMRWSQMQRITGLERYAYGSAVYPGNLAQVLGGNAFRHFPFTEQVLARPCQGAHYEFALEGYLLSPGIEKIIKTGLYDVAAAVLFRQVKEVDESASTVLGYLRLQNRNQLASLVRNGGTIGVLSFIQEALRHGKELTDGEIKLRSEMDGYISKNGQLKEILASGADTRAFLRYMMKELGLTNLKDSRNYYRFITAYAEYVRDMAFIGVGLTKKNRYPSQLFKALESASKQVELKKKLMELDRLKELNNSIDKVAKRVERKLRQELLGNEDGLFVSEKDKYCIVLPHSITDLSAEGAALSHCLGSHGYDSRIAEGESLILFVRRKTRPETSFYTMEYGLKEKAILQCRTSGDGSYDAVEPEGFEVKRAIFQLVKDRKKEKGKEYLLFSRNYREEIGELGRTGKYAALVAEELLKASAGTFSYGTKDVTDLRKMHIDTEEYLRQIRFLTRDGFAECEKALRKSMEGRTQVLKFSREIEDRLRKVI